MPANQVPGDLKDDPILSQATITITMLRPLPGHAAHLVIASAGCDRFETNDAEKFGDELVKLAAELVKLAHAEAAAGSGPVTELGGDQS